MPLQPPPMKGSLKIGSFAGIGVFVHWSFLLLPAVMAGTRLMADGPLADRILAAAVSVLFVLATFVCVVLHEYGHALTARRFGVRTRDIVLLPIGGVARLERMPRNPVQELWIALAGPAVNVVIACVLAVIVFVIAFARGDVASALTTTGVMGFATMMVGVNIALIVFNMIPAFPMDGGRVLRALLAMRMEHSRATAMAARVGQGIAVIFVGVGLYFGMFLLMFVGVMVFLGAGTEARQARLVGRLRGLTVRDAMATDFRLLPAEMPLSRCEQVLLEGSQQDCPVVDVEPDGSAGRYIGMLLRPTLRDAVQRGLGGEPAAKFVETIAPALEPEETVLEALERMQSAGVFSAAAMEEGRVVGLVTLAEIGRLLQLRAAR